MEFRILGPLEVRGELGAVALSGIKPRAVLAMLLLHANEPVSAERLALALWGDDAPAGATKTVQVHVSRLRKALGDPQVIVTTPTGYRLRVRPDELDAERFGRGVEDGRRALAGGQPEDAGVVLREALAWWRGAPLEEFASAPFAPAAIHRLEELRLSALELRVEADLGAGRHAELIGELQGLTASHPWRERLHGQLMLALYRSGRQADALDAFRRVRTALVEQLGIEPGAELRSLHQGMLRHDAVLDADRTTLAVAGARRRGLPWPPNRTIGRGHEVREVVELLRARPVRLLTLTGPGGVGKTRLALEAARTVEADFADGAHFVSLAAVKRPENVSAAIVRSLSIIPLAGESADHAVDRFLAAKHLLLVMDNCEHLPDAAPYIGRLPADARAVTVLATSRAPLAVQVEQRYAVPPLALPHRGTPEDAQALADVASVALFCERARARAAGFAWGDRDLEAVAEICRRVDGLPLAIELAAARCGLLSPVEIAERLQGALAALGTGPHDAPARQRTLRATIDWSYDLLTDDEKACVARFAVFAGGATVPAAEAITGADIDILERLLAKSLLVRRDHAPQPARLGMLETVRAYAAERLACLADHESVRERHYHYFLALAQRHGTDRAMCGSARNEHLARLDAEVDNLRAALAWAMKQDSAAPALELCAALGEYWTMRDRYAEAIESLERALSKPDADAAPAVRVRALCAQSWTLWALGRGDETGPVMADAEAIARILADPGILSQLLSGRAVQEGWHGRDDLASTLAEEALCWARNATDPWALAMAAWARALTAGRARDLGERVEQAALLLEQAGNVFHRADVFHWAAYEALQHGRDRDAREWVDRAIPLVRELEKPFLSSLLLGKSGLAALFSGDTEAAKRAFREQLELCRDRVFLHLASEGLSGLAAIAAVQDDLDRAARLSGAATAHRYDQLRDLVNARLDATFVEPARTRHGTDTWDTAVRDGAALSINDAIAYALDEPQRPTRDRAPQPPPTAGDDHRNAMTPPA
jgi:predicted ATPase/DNA-binding SARP family transcriptional activator